jgi:hypothetical protein
MTDASCTPFTLAPLANAEFGVPGDDKRLVV